MVKKLLKYEFIYYLRTFGAFLPIVLVIGAVTKLFLFLEEQYGGKVIEIASGSSVFMLVVACFALLLLPTVVGIVRFYKNMYSSEGYLTFTLPVTNAQHIFVKLLGVLGCYLFCALTVIASASIAMAGNTLGNVIADIVGVIKGMAVVLGSINVTFICIEMLILLILSMCSNMLLYYSCITIGQTAKKNRILAAVGVYFAYYIITQVISTVFSIVFIVGGTLGAFEDIALWIAENYIASIHLIMCGGIVLSCAIAALFWLINQTIMKKKLNLE
ncbi:MAG: hypothetical protein IKB86_05295 [Clostridia bacterium]|nr:hypothetical protein [Clostridia bacterium]